MLCCCGRKESAALQAKRKQYEKESTYLLADSILPVFIAAGVNNFVAYVIFSISDGSEDAEEARIGQQFVYTVLSYSVGRYLYSFLVDYQLKGEPKEDASPILNQLSSWNLVPLLSGILNENAAFSIKEFLVLVILEGVYPEHGFGPAFGTWLGWGMLFLVIIALMLYIEGRIGTSLPLRSKLATFDADSFSLAIAAVIVAIVATGLSAVGYTFISDHSVLFNYREDDDISNEGISGNESLFNALFTFGATLYAGVLLVIEDLLCSSKKEEGELDRNGAAREAEPGRTGLHESLSVGPDEDTRQGRNVTMELISEGWKELHHGSLGCLCGVAYFTFITDNLMYMGGHTVAGHLLLAAVLAAILTWRGPPCIANLRLREEFTRRKWERAQEKRKKQQREQEEQRSARLTASQSASQGVAAETLPGVNPVAQSAEEAEGIALAQELAEQDKCCRDDTPCCCCLCMSCMNKDCTDQVFMVRVHRNRLQVVATRLTIGWIWEVLVVYFFRWVTESSEASSSEQGGVQFASVMTILLLSAMVHLVLQYYRAKDAEQERLEEQRRQEQLQEQMGIENPLATPQLMTGRT